MAHYKILKGPEWSDLEGWPDYAFFEIQIGNDSIRFSIQSPVIEKNGDSVFIQGIGVLDLQNFQAITTYLPEASDNYLVIEPY